MGKIVESFVRDNVTGKTRTIYTVLKKSKTGKQLLKNFYTKKEAKAYMERK